MTDVVLKLNNYHPFNITVIFRHLIQKLNDKISYLIKLAKHVYNNSPNSKNNSTGTFILVLTTTN